MHSHEHVNPTVHHEAGAAQTLTIAPWERQYLPSVPFDVFFGQNDEDIPNLPLFLSFEGFSSRLSIGLWTAPFTSRSTQSTSAVWRKSTESPCVM